MRKYGNEKTHNDVGVGRSGRKINWKTGRVGGSRGRVHQHCGICHPCLKNCKSRARRAARKEIDMNTTEKIQKQLDEAGYENAIAIATEAEIQAQAACGQLAMVVECDDEEE